MTSATTGIAGTSGSGTSMTEVLQAATDDPKCREIGGFVLTEDAGQYAYFATANPASHLSDIAESAKLSANAQVAGRYAWKDGEVKRIAELVNASG